MKNDFEFPIHFFSMLQMLSIFMNFYEFKVRYIANFEFTGILIATCKFKIDTKF